MIIGIGIDIIDTLRIKKTFNKFGDKFKKRCFSLGEIKRSDNRDDCSHYARQVQRSHDDYDSAVSDVDSYCN